MTTDQTVHETVVAADGTRISTKILGDGEPVVVLPGSLNVGGAWTSVARLLAEDYRVVLVDRRNYGRSGRSPRPYSFEREAEDVRAVIERAGGRAHLLGHSAGALLALAAARQSTEDLLSLMLYEPPILAGGAEIAPAVSEIVAKKEAGDVAGALRVMLQRIVRIPEASLAEVPGDGWSWDPAAIRDGMTQDVESLVHLTPEAGQWAVLDGRVPTLLMAGADSWEDPLRRSARAIASVLPHATEAVWPGQTHFANLEDPDLVAATVREFLSLR